MVLFIVLVAPGFLFGQLASRRRPTPEESAFCEVGRVVSASLLFNLFAFGVLAMFAAYGTHLFVAWRYKAHIKLSSAWSRVLRYERPDRTVPHARIRLNNGTIYVGRVASFSADFELKDREIVLAPPLFAKPPGGEVVALPPD